MRKFRARRTGTLAVAATIVGALCATSQASAAPLQVDSVTARNARTIDIKFNQELGSALRSTVDSNNTNTMYLHQFVRIAGGQTGESDAALTGTPLSTAASGTRSYDVDTPEHDTLRVILPAATTLVQGRSYRFWLDGDGPVPSNTSHSLQLADLLFTGKAASSAMPGTKSNEVTFTGNAASAPQPSITSAEATNARTVRVTLGSALLRNPTSAAGNMPRGTYTSTTNIRLTPAGGGAAIAPVYVEHVRGTDKRVYDLQFPTELNPAATYTLTLARGLNLVTFGGQSPTGVDLTFPGIAGAAPAYAAPDIQSVSVNDKRDELRIKFTRRVLRVKVPDAPLPSGGTQNLANNDVLTPGQTPAGWLFIRETHDASNAVGEYDLAGTTLSADDVRALLNLDGVVADDGGTPGAWNKVTGSATSAANRLHDVGGFFADRRTLVLNFETGVRLTTASTGSVSLKPGTVTDVTGATNGAGVTASFTTPQSTGDPAAPAAGYDPTAADYLSVDPNAKTTFRHWAYTFNNSGNVTPPDYNVRAQDVNDWIVDQQLNAIVVENKYVKATFLPGMGGRLLSLVYKPTGKDLLFTNEVGSPYNHGATFYAGWLMVYAGVFPTFNTAEHGKYWFLPFDFDIKETADKVTISMSRVDDLDFSGASSRYPQTPTNLKLTVDYVVHKTKPMVDMNVRIENKTGSSQTYEYWTCTTLAPGDGISEGSPTMSIMAPVSRLQNANYAWMNNVEDILSGSGGRSVLKYDKLAKMINWATDGAGGIAYGQDLATNPQGDWWGVVNNENGEGVVRVGQNDETPGMKYWEWGYNRSFNSNAYMRGDSARPYIELWAGVTPEFFATTTIADGATKAWTETYMPTMDMKDTTNANTEGAAFLEFENRTVTGRVWPTNIGKPHTATIVDADTGREIASQTFVADPLKSAELTGSAPAGTRAKLILKNAAGETILTAERADGLGTIDPPVAAGNPTISGEPKLGATLTGVDTTWTGSNATKTYAWLRDGQPIAAATGTTYTITSEDVGRQIAFRVTAVNDGGTVSVTSAAVRPDVRVDGGVGGNVPATLSLALSAPAAFGAFVPGVATTYTATTHATVTSSAGDASLTVADPSPTNTGHLVNGSFSLPQPLKAAASSAGGSGGAAAVVGGLSAPTPLLSYAGPVSNDDATVTFTQAVGASDGLRTGTYAKTLTFTLSTTTP